MQRLLGPVSDAFRFVFEFFHSVTHNWALAIILLTIAIRVVLFPLYRYQTKLTLGMKEIQPKQKELQEKYKDKPEEYQKRLMELYKTHKVNPLGGCLPLLVQMPILIALFAMLRKYPFGDSAFLWLPGMDKKDPLLILPILSAVTTWFQMRQTVTDPSQQTMTMIMPVFIGFMSKNFPAGLNIYWVVGNLISILQQQLMMRPQKAAKAAKGEAQ